MNAVIHRFRSMVDSLRANFTRAPSDLPKDPFGEPPRETPHGPLAYQSEAAKAPSVATMNFHLP